MLVLNPGFLSREYFKANMQRLVNENVEITVQILRIVAVCNKEVFNEALSQFVGSSSTTLNTLELVYTLALTIDVEQQTLDSFTSGWLEACKAMDSRSMNKNLRLICKFAIELIKKHIFYCGNNLETWLHYCSYFGNNSYIRELKALITNVSANKKA